MLTAGDVTQMQGDLARIRGDREEAIAIRRGTETLDVQPVRIARASVGRALESEGAQESRARVVVMGGPDLDVQPGDRFNDEAGVLYRVILVRPNRRAAVTAEAEVIE